MRARSCSPASTSTRRSPSGRWRTRGTSLSAAAPRRRRWRTRREPAAHALADGRAVLLDRPVQARRERARPARRPARARPDRAPPRRRRRADPRRARGAVGSGGADLGQVRDGARGRLLVRRRAAAPRSGRAAAGRLRLRARPAAPPADAHLLSRARGRRGSRGPRATPARDADRAGDRRRPALRHPNAGRARDGVLRALTPFEGIFVPDEIAQAVSDRAWLEALLDAERALASAEALADAIPVEAAAAVTEACRPELYDATQLAVEGRAAGNPVEPLVRALRERVGGDAAQYVHWGATSQDILDSAAMLVARRGLWLIVDELAAVADLCAALAREHRATPMAARTLLQQAVPTTFGLKAAGWLVAGVESRTRLLALASELPAQLGGAGGTLAALGDAGMDVLRLYAVELELREPVLPWHTNRRVVAELGAALAGAAGAAGKIGGGIPLVAPAGGGEGGGRPPRRSSAMPAEREPGAVALRGQSGGGGGAERSPGGSSTMPQKRTPVAAVLAAAGAARAHGAAPVLTAGLVQEHERAAGAWHAEWHALSEALAAAGGAA